MPVAVTDAARLFVFPPQEHAGIIAKIAPPNKEVFGTTLSWRTRLPRKLTVVAVASPLKLFSRTAQTDELGLVYNRYHLPWPARDRDSLIETKYTNDYKTGEVTIRFKAIDAVGEPPRRDVIRLTKAEGILYLKVLDEGKTFVRYEVNLDPGGWLPQWICNFFVRDAPVEMLQAMKQRIAEQQHLRPDCREPQMRLWHGGHRK